MLKIMRDCNCKYFHWMQCWTLKSMLHSEVQCVLGINVLNLHLTFHLFKCFCSVSLHPFVLSNFQTGLGERDIFHLTFIHSVMSC